MTTAFLTPLDLADATQVGRRTYRKQVLPLTTINYKGRTVTFDKAYLTDLANSFRNGAYDQVPTVFADDKNGHNMDPTRFSGEVKGFEVTNDGLDAIVELTDDGAKAVGNNPRLGVSARIVEGLAKADGRTFNRAIQHVLLTMDPRVTNMRPWETVDLSGVEDDTEVVDLTAATYEEDAVAKGTVDKDNQTIKIGERTFDLSAMTDEEFGSLLELSTTAVEDEVAPAPVDGEAVAPTEETAKDGEIYEKDGKQYVKIEGAVFCLTPEESGKIEDNKVEGGVTDTTADLSNPVVDSEARSEVSKMRIDLAAERWKTERTNLLRDGVPRAMLDLAAPLLSTPEAVVIDLSGSDGDKDLNATDIVRKMLGTFKGMVDLHPEIGHQVDLSEDDDTKTDPDAALLSAWESQYSV